MLRCIRERRIALALEYRVLRDNGDDRGHSYEIEASAFASLRALCDMHLTSIRPGKTRGDHFHERRNEILIIIHRDSFELRWDSGEGTEIEHRQFEGGGTVLVTVPPKAAHAVVNTGGAELTVLGLSDGEYEPSETVRRPLG